MLVYLIIYFPEKKNFYLIVETTCALRNDPSQLTSPLRIVTFGRPPPTQARYVIKVLPIICNFCRIIFMVVACQLKKCHCGKCCILFVYRIRISILVIYNKNGQLDMPFEIEIKTKIFQKCCYYHFYGNLR